MNAREKLYDALCDEADAILKAGNPCKATCNGCAHGNFCCDGCKHLSPNGCTAKALTCKLWLCWPAGKANPETKKRLDQLHDKASENFVLLFRGSKEEILEAR